MPTPIVQVDAFAEEPFSGNPAAVCLLDAPADERWMQLVAAEMNLSETAFVHPLGEAWGLRWFTPKVEVDLCGHATLATAHVLAARTETSDLEFHTRSGVLTATVLDGGSIVMDFPADPVHPIDPPSGLVDALGVRPTEVHRGATDVLVVLDDPEAVRQLEPDIPGLAKVAARGIIVTAADDDIVSRFFAPAVGVPEDPVTGSAHCTLGPYWAQRLGKRLLRAEQASPRGGALYVEPSGDRVELRGRAVTVMRGELTA